MIYYAEVILNWIDALWLNVNSGLIINLLYISVKFSKVFSLAY